MNDASPSTSSDQPPVPNSDESNASPEAIASGNRDPLQEKKRIQRDQKAAFLDHLIRNIDILIYCQLSILYYMEYSSPSPLPPTDQPRLNPNPSRSISLSTFLLRALPHWFYFTPKPAIFPTPPTGGRGRPYIGIVFGTNVFCILLHLLFKPPAAGEATRGYLHGGLLIDFVGQKSPVGRWRLVGLDLLVLVLQLVILGVTLERRGTKTGVTEEAMERRQDHDAEERGMLRQDSDDTDDIELQDLQHTSGRTGGDEDRERDELLQAGANSEQRDQHPLDPFYTGNHIITNLNVIDTICAQWHASSVTGKASDAAATSDVHVAAVQAAAGRIRAMRELREV